MKRHCAWALFEICETEDFEKNKNNQTNRKLLTEFIEVKVSLIKHIKLEIQKKAIELFGEIWKSLLLENLEVYYADLTTKLCLIRFCSACKEEFLLLNHFVKIADLFMLKVVHICATMNQCKKVMKQYLIGRQVLHFFPKTTEEIKEACGK